MKLDPAAVPPLPYEGRYDGTGYDWMDAVAASRSGWHVVPSWGLDGWDLGQWPYVIVCHYDGPGRYGLAVYCEGDLKVWAFDTEAERDAETDQVAHHQWRARPSAAPDDLPDKPADIRPHHRGPFSWQRIDREQRR